MRAFVQVGKQASFSAAAKHLGRDQSVINRQVTALEERLGRKLVSRRGKSVRLTDDGLTYFRYASEALEAFDRAEECMGKLPTHKEVVCIWTSPVLASALVVPRLQEMQRRLGELSLHVSTTATSSRSGGQVLQVVVDYVSRQSHPVGEVLGAHDWVLLASADIARRLNSRHLEHGGHGSLKLLLFDEDNERGPWFFVRGQSRIQAAVRPCLTTDNPAVLLEAAAKGQGLALVPGWLAVQEGGLGLVRVFPEWQMEPALGPAQLVARYEGQVRGAESLRRVVKFLAESLRDGRLQ